MRPCSRWLWLAAILILTSACTTRPVVSPAQQSAAWQQHRLAVSQLQGWSLAARVSIQREEKAWSGKIHWQQSPADYQIQFNAPFGQGAFQVVGSPGEATMRFSDGQSFQGDSAEEIIAQQTGWRLPVSALQFWVAGVPQPGTDSQLGFDDYGRLASLEQDRWQIRYTDYVRVDGLELPRKLVLENTELTLRLVIDDWVLSPATS